MSFAAVGAAPAETFTSQDWPAESRPAESRSAESWADATEHLVERGSLTPDSTATEVGHAGRAG